MTSSAKSDTAPQVRQHIFAQVDGWIKDTARRLDIAVTVYPDGMSRNGNWLSVPVAINQPGNAYQHAVLLQKIEDEWDENSHNDFNLLLTPAHAEQPSNVDTIKRFNDLTARQQQILNRLAEEGANSIEAERFQAIRQEWEETMREVDSLFPTLAQPA